MNNMLNSEMMDALIDTFKAMKEYARIRGDGPIFMKDRERAEKKFDEQLTKLETLLYSDKE